MGLFQSIIDTFQQASIYILIGLFFSGLIQAFISSAQITRHLGASNFKSVLWATLVGIPLPLCSCGVIPAAIALRRNGASKGATLSFLISTPETDIDSIMLSFALLDPLTATFRLFAGIVTGIIAGVVENIFGKRDKQGIDALVTGELQVDKGGAYDQQLLGRLRKGMNQAFVALLADMAPWLIFGLVLAGGISYLVPASMIERLLGQGFSSMLLMLLVGIPLYVCASASTPIAAALILKGMSPGAALVFLLVGPATNITTIVMTRKFLGRRATVIYLISLAGCALGLGLLLNWLYVVLGLDIKALLGKASHVWPPQVESYAAVILALLIAHALYRKYL